MKISLLKFRSAIFHPHVHSGSRIWELDTSSRIRAAIEQRGGFAFVSENTDISIPVLKSYAHGGKMPSLLNAGMIAQVCDVSVDWLLQIDRRPRLPRFKRKMYRIAALIRDKR